MGISASAHATIVDLTFDGIATTYPFTSSTTFIENYYNGGTSSVGTSGPNYGIAFSSNALNICLNSTTVSCSNTSKGGLGPANSREGALFFLSGSSTFMDVAAGFTTGFSFNYASFTESGSVSVFSGLDGSGSLLGTIALSPNVPGCPAYGADFCPFSPVGVGFLGTAMSVEFAGVENQIVFDDVTFGSVTPGIPELSTWAMMGLGFAFLGFAGYRKAKSGRTALSAA